jgi:alpha-tubulin suppressor-like RCC1 family protein
VESHKPTPVTGLSSGVISIAAGTHFTCALLDTGGVECWGLSDQGQLGAALPGGGVIATLPLEVQGFEHIGLAAISAGDRHACALDLNGIVWCWGANSRGQLGNGTTTDSNTPARVNGLPYNVTAISAGGLHTCARLSNGGLACWGDNEYGELGSSLTTSGYSTTPQYVEGLSGVAIAVSASVNRTCALLDSGLVRCWGAAGPGIWGLEPVTVQDLDNAIALSAAEEFACAVTSTGSVECWGDANEYGQLGHHPDSAQDGPMVVERLPSAAVAVTTGSRHACALLSDGRVFCWGSNYFGQVGDGSTSDRWAAASVLPSIHLPTSSAPRSSATPAAAATMVAEFDLTIEGVVSRFTAEGMVFSPPTTADGVTTVIGAAEDDQGPGLVAHVSLELRARGGQVTYADLTIPNLGPNSPFDWQYLLARSLIGDPDDYAFVEDWLMRDPTIEGANSPNHETSLALGDTIWFTYAWSSDPDTFSLRYEALAETLGP